MNITVNGQAHSLAAASTLADLIESLGYAGKRIAIERNGDIVPRSQYARTLLCEADRIEIVVAVGGG